MTLNRYQCPRCGASATSETCACNECGYRFSDKTSCIVPWAFLGVFLVSSCVAWLLGGTIRSRFIMTLALMGLFYWGLSLRPRPVLGMNARIKILEIRIN